MKTKNSIWVAITNCRNGKIELDYNLFGKPLVVSLKFGFTKVFVKALYLFDDFIKKLYIHITLFKKCSVSIYYCEKIIIMLKNKNFKVMFGNLINNSLIKDLIKRKDLEITPYDDKLLQVAQYPLRAHIIYEIPSENETKQIHFFTEKESKFTLKSKTYYCIDVYETIKLPVGIVGRFIPSSNLIEKGLGLTAGKIEKPFGDKGEKIRFGLFNYLDSPVTLKFNDRIAYIQFMDLRGLDNHEYNQTKYEKKIYEFRLREDDGPNYELDNHD